MGKRQHQKDKMYLTYTEWSTLYGGKKPGSNITFKRLPFHYCCVSLQPFEIPYCDRDGNIFELQAIITYHKKYKTNPVTGKPLDMSSLIKLKFSRDKDGKYECPVVNKTFTPSSHIVCIAVTGNVFSYEAVEELNIKIKSMKDLITGENFKKEDIIILQDPSNLEKFNLTKFFHIKNEHNLEPKDSLTGSQKEDNLKNINKETQAVLDELKREYKAPTLDKKEKPIIADKLNAAHYSTGAVAASFTSTTLLPETKHQPAVTDEDVVRYERVTKKGYVRLITNFGPLNLELHCDIVPKTCENFMKLCQTGYYNNTVFHRSIRHFMIQGGDPTGSGSGGESVWGKPFKDEIKAKLSHTGRGILSMANSGPDTNKSQFFITYRSCQHLDGKHTVFGHVVGGLDTLNAIEKIEVDNKDRPIEEIVILKAQVFVDPYQEADEKLAAERKEAKQEEEKNEKLSSSSAPVTKLYAFHSGVGKYIKPSTIDTSSKIKSEFGEPIEKKKKHLGYSFGDFKDW